MVPDTHRADDPEGDVEAMARLRAANPVPDDAVGHLHTTARARALRAELTMQTESSHQTPDPTPATPPARSGPRWQRPLVAGLALVLLAVAGTVGALRLTGDEPPAGEVVADSDRVDPEAVDGELPADTPMGDEFVDPIMPGGGMALCAEMYSPETLVEREVAFLGTVTAIDGDAITFEVEEAFRGDLGTSVTLGGAEFLTIPNPDNVNPISVGGRYLVAGDGGFAWGCGFTHLYSDEVAAEWRAAFAS